jgi:transposase
MISMKLASNKDDIIGGPRKDDLEKEILEKLSPQAAKKVLALLRFPELLRSYLAENTDSQMKELFEFLAFLKDVEKSNGKISSSVAEKEDTSKSDEKGDFSPPKGPIDPEKNPEKSKQKEKKKKKNPLRKKKRSHAGARGAKAFPGARKVEHPISGLCAGGACPCNNGKLYPIDPSAKVLFEAKALLEAVIHLREKLRCNQCGAVFGALLPPELTERQDYHGATPEAAALSALSRYALGIPDLRLERLQEWLGTPFSNSRQFDIALQGFLTLKPLWEHWLCSLAQCPTLTADDAYQKVIALQKEIHTEKDRAKECGVSENQIRTGVQTTIVVGKNEQGHEIHAYITNREHQGESLNSLLQLRDQDLPPPALTTDAASKASTIRPFPAKDSRGFHTRAKAKNSKPTDPQVTHAHCLQHLRLAFEAIKTNHPEIASHVLQLLGAIYDNDSQAKTRSFTAEERKEFHATHSKPVLDALKTFLEEASKNPKAEPNGELGRTLAYALNHWPHFTEFTRTPGVALDTNACERDVYFVILHRINSLHYLTSNGAKVGDFFMSIAATCRSHKVNPLEYLGACLDFPSQVRHNPQNWMP